MIAFSGLKVFGVDRHQRASGAFVGGNDRRNAATLRACSMTIAAGRAALQAKAQERAADLAATVKELEAAGAESLRAIAEGLEGRGIPAARGGKWSAVQVARLLDRAGLSRPFEASAGGGVQ